MPHKVCCIVLYYCAMTSMSIPYAHISNPSFLSIVIESVDSIRILYITSQVPINKKIRPTYEVIMIKWWWNLWWNYDVVCFKMFSSHERWLDAEFEPSVEEITDYQWDTCMAILSVCFLWRARTLGGISLFNLTSMRRPSTNCTCAKSRSRLLGA
jgi:hypothetical protein